MFRDGTSNVSGGASFRDRPIWTPYATPGAGSAGVSLVVPGYPRQHGAAQLLLFLHGLTECFIIFEGHVIDFDEIAPREQPRKIAHGVRLRVAPDPDRIVQAFRGKLDRCAERRRPPHENLFEKFPCEVAQIFRPGMIGIDEPDCRRIRQTPEP